MVVVAVGTLLALSGSIGEVDLGQTPAACEKVAVACIGARATTASEADAGLVATALDSSRRSTDGPGRLRDYLVEAEVAAARIRSARFAAARGPGEAQAGWKPRTVAAREGEAVGPPEPTPGQRMLASARAASDEAEGPTIPDKWFSHGSLVLAGAVAPLSMMSADLRRPAGETSVTAVAPTTPVVAAVEHRSQAAPVSVRDSTWESEDADSDFEEFPAASPADLEVEPAPAVQGLRHRFRWGESMTQVLTRAGVDPDEVDDWIRATNAEYNVNRVYAGQELELTVALSSRELQQLRMEIDPRTALVVERHRSGPRARREEIPFDRALRAVGGRIDRSLYVTAQSFGIPEKIISDMAEILGWDLDLSTDVEPGAAFRLIYEELTRPETMETIPGRLLAVELVNRGELHEGYYFSMPDGSHAGYYDRGGKGIGRSFLRFPVAFNRVTSSFSSGRFHPILKIRVPHYGVDFAAPAGTPVRAVADGRVLTAGWNGGNGKFVRLQHDSVYETGYSHLSAVAPSVRVRGWVRQGQVIGYVGATGLATGPHLHFAMYRNGKYVDPLKANLPRTLPLEGRTLAAYRMRLDMMERTYAGAGLEHVPTQVARTLSAPTGMAGGGQ
jgi:murein DD-endopeptidase MepM/ murein hydrolase activator NlpD